MAIIISDQLKSQISRSRDPWCLEIGENGHDIAKSLVRLQTFRNTNYEYESIWILDFTGI